MAAPVVKLKRSSVPGKVPLTTDIDLGEIAINTFDGKAYFKKDDGAESIVEIGTGAGGGAEGITKLDSLTGEFDGTQTSFTLRVNGTAYVPEYLNALLISLGGVVQIPTSAYTISGATITFTAPPPAGTSFHGIDFKIGESVASQPTPLINENKIIIDESVVIGDGYNGLSVGPIEVAATYSVEVPAGSTWVIL